MKKARILLFSLFPLVFSCGKERKTQIFEAEDAAFENCSIEKVQNQDVSNDALIGFIKKGSRISFGIQVDQREQNITVEARISCPLLYKEDGSYPCPFVFSDIYLVTVNDVSVEIENTILKPEEKDVFKDNYYAFVQFSFALHLEKGKNILSFSCISSSNDTTSRYASVGNFDCLTFQGINSLSFFKPEIKASNNLSYSFNVEKKVFCQGERISVLARRREGHEKDWIALLPFDDLTGQPISSFYLSDEEESYDLNSGRDVSSGNYRVCFFKDDSYESVEEFPIFVCQQKEDMDLFTFRVDGESVFVTSKQREGHTKDWIALYRETDRLGKIGSLYYYYPKTEVGEIDITTQNRNTERKDMNLSKGRFKLCYCKDDSYNELLVLYFYLP